MYRENDYVMYKKSTCQVKKIKHDEATNEDYYVLSPLDDKTLTITIPTTNKGGFLRPIISKKEAQNLINRIPLIEPLKNINDKYIENTYKELFYQGSPEDLIKIIKTTYLRNDKRRQNKQKLSEKDEDYFAQAEKYLYNELAIALDMSFEDTKKYIVEKVAKLMQ